MNFALDTRKPASGKARVVGVIPARLESRRLERKALRQIAGRAMIEWVYRGARAAPSLDDLFVATDSPEIFDHCGRRGIPALMTSGAHRSGTERLVEVMSRQPADIYVNIQGDEPLVTGDHIDLLLRPFRESPATQVATLKVAMSAADAQDPNHVKVVTDPAGRALYFSRAPVPYSRALPSDPQNQPAGERQQAQYYKHLGLYAYSAEALREFSRLVPSPLEQIEQLEQLRFLENGIPILVVATTVDTIGVDTEDDLKLVAERLVGRSEERY